MFCQFNVFPLAGLIATNQEQYELLFSIGKVNSISCAEVESGFKDRVSNWFNVAHHFSGVFGLANPEKDATLRIFIAKLAQPLVEILVSYYLRKPIVVIKLQQSIESENRDLVPRFIRQRET